MIKFPSGKARGGFLDVARLKSCKVEEVEGF